MTDSSASTESHSINVSNSSAAATGNGSTLGARNANKVESARSSADSTALISKPFLSLNRANSTLADELYVISSDSTHDVARVFDKNRSLLNRSIWALIWFTAFALFVIYMVFQTMYLTSNPTNTLITAEFVTPTLLPNVSVCISSLDVPSVRQFLHLNTDSTPREQMTGLFNTSGVLCYFTWQSLKQLWQGRFETATDCRSTASISFVDYPFALQPTLCLTTTVPLFAEAAGASITFIGHLPNASSDTLTYAIRRNGEVYQPQVSNLVTMGAHTRVRFSIQNYTFIQDCDPRPGGQPECFAEFQQACVEESCNCSYPILNDINSFDMSTQIPGSCVLANLNGTCTYTTSGLTAPPNSQLTCGTNCTLAQVCGSTQAQRSCPFPSCETSLFPQVTSLAPISPSLFATSSSPDFNSSVSTLFALTLVLDSQLIEVIEQVPGYTTLSYLGAIGGMLGLLLGYSVLSIAEWLEGCWRVMRKVGGADENVEMVGLKRSQ